MPVIRQIGLLLCCLAGAVQAQAQVQAPRLDLSIGFYRRQSLAPQQGMLFIFPERARHCMWMKNTLLPLSVAFLDEAGAIINIEDMAPETENNHCAAGPARYALEVNRGWFAGKGIRPGARVAGLEKSPPPR